jgi:hypothetical protein
VVVVVELVVVVMWWWSRRTTNRNTFVHIFKLFTYLSCLSRVISSLLCSINRGQRRTTHCRRDRTLGHPNQDRHRDRTLGHPNPHRRREQLADSFFIL